MAIINMERVAQLKKEKDIELNTQEVQLKEWVDSILTKTLKCSTISKDVYDTYYFFANNKLDTKLFDVEGYSFSFCRWSSYSNYRNHIKYNITDDIYVLYFFDNKIVLHSGSHYELRLYAKSIKGDATLKSLAEDFSNNLEVYCNIIVERLNNI